MNIATSIGLMQNSVAAAFAGTTIKVYNPAVSVFADDMAVTISSAASCTVDCSNPRSYVADDKGGDRSLMGSTFVLVDRSDANLTIEPQSGMVAEVSGEQYRIEKAEYLPGAVRIYLRGGAAEGTASA